MPLSFYPIAIVLVLFFVAILYPLGYMLLPHALPYWLWPVLASAVTIIPFVWFKLWHQSEWCLVAVTLGMVFGENAPALFMPLVLILTFPNCLLLLWHSRRSVMRWVVIPFLLLAAIYAYSSIAFNEFSYALPLTIFMLVKAGIPYMDLQYGNALLGLVMIYLLVYIPLLLIGLTRGRL